MAEPIRKLVRSLVPERYRSGFSRVIRAKWGSYFRSYSQQGEDMILRILFEGVTRGFYVDVGAHHPTIYSNTYYFYCRGWRGINIDATPGSMRLFQKIRHRDINLELAISNTRKDLTLYTFSDPALNTLSEEVAKLQCLDGVHQLTSRRRITTSTLAEALDGHAPAGVGVDFLSVDVEGLDLDVLESNNWKKYIPRAILCEDLSVRDVESATRTALYAFLHAKGYSLFSKCIHTLIFTHESF